MQFGGVTPTQEVSGAKPEEVAAASRLQAARRRSAAQRTPTMVEAPPAATPHISLPAGPSEDAEEAAAVEAAAEEDAAAEESTAGNAAAAEKAAADKEEVAPPPAHTIPTAPPEPFALLPPRDPGDRTAPFRARAYRPRHPPRVRHAARA